MQAQRLLPHCRLCLRRVSGHRRFAVSRSRHLSATPESATDPEPAIPPPPLDGKPREYPEKIRKIVDDISHLTLLETSQLNDLLKVTLNIPDAPVMAMGAMAGAPAAAPQSAPADEPKEEQTAFTVNLVKFAADSKIKLIKEVKAQSEGMNLVQAKKFVESLPKEVKAGISKEDAKKLAAALEAVGGTVEIV